MSSAIKPALLWMDLPTDLPQRLRRCLDKATAELSSIDAGIIFFRADDVGAPGRNFTRLVELFQGHQVPLTMAVVPAWLTKPRWQRILELCGNRRDLWGWVQHGWRHQNYEPHGKKQEFGPSRPLSQKRKDLQLGSKKLSVMMGENFLPVFIPPWNRCDQETLSVLPELGYEALSLFQGTRPGAPPGIIDYPVGVDLHTRKDRDSEGGWQSLLAELDRSLASGFCGIMIHHQRMNDAAFDFLDSLLLKLKQWKNARLVHLGNLVEERYRAQTEAK